jgi:hypothetical protein
MFMSDQLFAPAALTPGKEQVGPTADLDEVAKRKIPAPIGNRIPAVQSVIQSLLPGD